LQRELDDLAEQIESIEADLGGSQEAKEED
jgi:hypothetical protein